MQYLISDDTRERHYKIHLFVIKKKVVKEGAWFVVPAHTHAYVRQAPSFSLDSLPSLQKSAILSQFAVGHWRFVLIHFFIYFIFFLWFLHYSPYKERQIRQEIINMTILDLKKKERETKWFVI